MPIPNFQDFMLPLLQSLKDGKEHSNQEIYESLESSFDMTEEEKNRLLPSGKQRIFINRAAWAKSHLKHAGLLQSTRRSHYKITEEGLNVLNVKSLSNINVNYLMQFPSFVAFRTCKKIGEIQQSPLDKVEVSSGQEMTPEEHIECGFDSINENLKEEIITNVKGCSFRFFEKLVIDLLLAMGYGGSRQEAGRLTSQGSDEGIDGIINEDKLGLDVIYIQAKRWDSSVSRPEIQKFAGALQGKRAKKGIFITTSEFTKEAYAFARSIESKIILIDRDRLAELMLEHDVGVSVVQKYLLKKVDSDYFVED